MKRATNPESYIGENTVLEWRGNQNILKLNKIKKISCQQTHPKRVA